MPYIALITQKSTRSTITWLKIGFQVRVDKTVCSFFIVSENILTFADEENQPSPILHSVMCLRPQKSMPIEIITDQSEKNKF